MDVDLGIWARLTRLIKILLFLAAALAVVVWYLPVIRQNEEMRKVIHKLDTRITAHKARQRYLETTIKALRNDPAAVERLAREKLGYAKPGETIIRFEPVSEQRR